MTARDRYRGALLGLAAGDALGTTVEFESPGTFTPLTDIVGGGPFRLQPGEWTDDTSMALCLAESLVECRGFHAIDQLNRYCRWMNQGYYSVKGRCFDIGLTTRAALMRFEQSPEPFCGRTDSGASGNGGIMRLAPVPLAFAKSPLKAVALSADSSRTTHASPECLDAARYLGGLIVGAVHGVAKERLLEPFYAPVPGLWDAEPLAPKVAEIAGGSFRAKEPPEIVGSGYVVKSLEAALWAFAKSDDFRTGALLAVNLGDDADTTGAVYGQLAGAYYGVDGIPAHWRELIAMRERIEQLADGLWELAES